MINIQLPISKSIASRILILQFLHNQPLYTIQPNDPDDLKILHFALTQLRKNKQNTFYLENNGTALRFLTVLCATLPQHETILIGNTRLNKRPMTQLVKALNNIGGNIEYLDEINSLPIKIKGRELDKAAPVFFNNPLSTQFISALMLLGFNVSTNINSPYINMTRSIIASFLDGKVSIEKDWTSASYWYEHVALHGTPIYLPNLKKNSLQGDSIVADIFSNLNVQTTYDDNGVILTKKYEPCNPTPLSVDFSSCPDLYPSVAITCWRKKIPLVATHTQSLHYKESDRLETIKEIIHNKSDNPCFQTRSDHRIAMALLSAYLPCDNTQCIAKSYPLFLQELCKLKES